MTWRDRRKSQLLTGHQKWQTRWTGLAALLAAALLVIPAAALALPGRIPLVQGEVSDDAPPMPGQVIAQGIARLPRGEVAWTVRRIDVPGGEGAAVAAFPLGFGLGDGGTVALLDETGETLDILDRGEAAFLPEGRSGALTSSRGDAAGFYEVALVSGEDANAGATAGDVVGNPFAVPGGRAAEIELARESLAVGEEVTVPVASSATPVLFVLTSGAAQIAAPGGEAAELAAGQFAMLLGEVTVRSAGDVPAVFVVASIDEAAGAADDAGTPEARAARAGRQRDAGATVSGGGDAPREERTREPRTRRERTGGRGGQGAQGSQGAQGGQAAPQETGGVSGAPVTGGVESPVQSAASPAPIPSPETAAPPAAATPPADTTVPSDGTPTLDTTAPTGEEAPGASTPAADTAIPEDETAAETLNPEADAPSAEAAPPAATDDQLPPTAAEIPVGESALPVAPVPAEETAPEAPAPAEVTPESAGGA